MIIYAKDMRAVGFCLVPGVKYFFERHGLDWKDFIKNGIDSEKLLATNDPLTKQVVEAAKNDR